MRCEICKQGVFGKKGITVLGIGAAHITCFEMEKKRRRMFGSIDISQLNDTEFNELYDLVMIEKNARSDNFENESIELF